MIKRPSSAVSVLLAFGFVALCVGCERTESTPSTDNSQDLEKSLERVKSLPYASWVPTDEAEKRGVTAFNPRLSYAGLNLYNSRPRNQGYLIDMEGNVVHTWSTSDTTNGWHAIQLNETGDLFVVEKDKALLKLDWDSNVVWRVDSRFHHEIAVAGNGDVYSLSRDTLTVPFESGTVPILNDYIVICAPDGTMKNEISVHDLLGDRVPEERLRAIAEHLAGADPPEYLPANGVYDVFHTNAIAIIDRDVGNLFKRDDIIVSVLEMNLLVAVDVETEEVYWSWGETELDTQHQPSLLTNDNLLVVDNGRDREYSRVIELNPFTSAIEWQYTGEPLESFYTEERGGAQELPNGNFLITESDKGRAFEITRDGELVWEFFNPDILGEELQERGAIYRMTRLDSTYLEPLRH